MTSNEINWLLFSLFVLAVLVQASAALVMLWTACDKRPPGRESGISVRSSWDKCLTASPNDLNSSDYRVLA
jgi:hypothetical protein